MKVNSRVFGEIDIDDEKIINFNEGIMGFEDMKNLTLIFDTTREEKKNAISWLQCLDDPELALPVINPFLLTDTYNPTVEDELMKPLGDFEDEDLLILLALSVPAGRPEDTTANFKAPFIINPNNRAGIQIVVNNDDYEIRTNVREAVEKMKAKKE